PYGPARSLHRRSRRSPARSLHPPSPEGNAMISIGINLILGVMLMCALVLGLRLERKLKALKQSHLDFAKAVSELDQASVRTEQSLASMRAASEVARTELAARID